MTSFIANLLVSCRCRGSLRNRGRRRCRHSPRRRPRGSPCGWSFLLRVLPVVRSLVSFGSTAAAHHAAGRVAAAETTAARRRAAAAEQRRCVLAGPKVRADGDVLAWIAFHLFVHESAPDQPPLHVIPP